MKMYCLIAAGLLGFGSGTAYAKGEPANKDKALVEILSHLKSADNYCYETTIVSEPAGRPREKELQKMSIYQSRERFVMYSKSEDALFFQDKDGQFRVNQKEKKVYYHLVQSDSELHKIQNGFNKVASSNTIDSTFLLHATIDGIKKENGMISYKLVYPKGIQVREMNIVFNVNTQFFDHISYVVVRVSPSDHKTVVMRQQVMMDGYQRKEPDEVQRLTMVTGKLTAYLQQAYPGYKMVKF